MPRFLGIDYGTKRIGLAVGDTDAAMAMPLTAVVARGDRTADAEAVAEVIHEYAIDEVVIGLPLNMDDSEGPQAKVTRAFGDALHRAASLPVHYQDERLSTISADELLRPAELTRKRKKARRDSVAAHVILQDFLDGRAGE